MSQSKFRSWFWRAVASLLLLWLVARKMDLQSFVSLFRGMRWEWLVASLGVMLLNRVMSISRAVILIRALGKPCDSRLVGRIVLGGEFLGSFLPSSIGGDGIRILGLRKMLGDTGLAVSVVMWERALGMLTLLLLGCGSAIVAWKWLDEPAVLLGALIPSAVLLIGASAMLSERLVDRMIHWMGLRGRRWTPKLLEWQQAIRLFRGHPKAIIQVSLISLLLHTCRVLSVYFVGLALGTEVRFVYFCIFVPLIMLISLMPISIGGFGVRENGYVHYFGLEGMPPAMAFGISLVSHVLTTLTTVPGGFWWLWGKKPAHQDGVHADRPLRILWVADKLSYGDRLHGVGSYYLKLLHAMPSTDIIPVVLRTTPNVAEQFQAQGLKLKGYRLGFYDLRTLRMLISVIRSEKIDVLHLHGYGASAFGRLAAWIMRKPCIIHQHDDIDNVPRWVRWGDRWMARETFRALAVSRSVKDFCVNRRGIPEERVEIWYNSVPLPERPPGPSERAAIHRELGIPEGHQVVGTITRLYPPKGNTYLVQAAAKVLAKRKDVTFLIIGDGEERGMLEEEAKRLGVFGSVRFLGFQAQAPRLLSALDCFVVPSVTEGSSFALIEAMAVGLPIVATAVGGNLEILEDKKNAVLVPARDPEAMGETILSVLIDKSLGEALGQKALADSRDFDVRIYTERLMKLYREASLSSRNGTAASSRARNARLGWLGIGLAFALTGFLVTAYGALREANRPSWEDTSGYLGHSLYIDEHGGLIGFLKESFSGTFPIVERHPLYMLLASPVADRTAEFFFEAKLLNLFLGLMTLLSLIWIAWQRFGSRTALLAGAFYGASQSLVTAASHVDCEVIFALTSLWAWWFITQKPSVRQWALAGICVGLAFLSKSSGILMAVAMPVAAVLYYFRRGIPWRSLAAFCATTLLVMSPLLVRNIKRHGQLLYEGLNSHVMWLDQWSQLGEDDTFIWEDQYCTIAIERNGLPDAAEYLKGHSPIQIAGRIKRGFILEAIMGIRAMAPAWPLPKPATLLFGLCLLAATLLGWWRERRTWPAWFLFVWGGGYLLFFAWHAQLFANIRYLAALVPIFLIYAAWFVWNLFSKRLPRWEPAVVAGLAVALAGLTAGPTVARGALTKELPILQISEAQWRFLEWIDGPMPEGAVLMTGPTDEYYGMLWSVERPMHMAVAPHAKTKEAFFAYLNARPVTHLVMHAENLRGQDRLLKDELSVYWTGSKATGIQELQRPAGWELVYTDPGQPQRFLIYSPIAKAGQE